MKRVEHEPIPDSDVTNLTDEHIAKKPLAYEPPLLEDFGQLRSLIRGVTGEGVDFGQLAFE